MKYFLCTDYRERPFTMELISIGLVAEDGRELYAVSSEFNESTASNWEKDNVLPYLGDVPRYPLSEIREQLLDFLDNENCRAEFIGWNCAYDFVLFGWLFGDKLERPYCLGCYDIKHAYERLRIRVTREFRVEFNALQRAKWVRDCYSDLAWVSHRKILVTQQLYQELRSKVDYVLETVFQPDNCELIPIDSDGFDQRGSAAYCERRGKYQDERVKRSIEQYQKEKKASG